jgi:octaprenyl-diphosphate synthase
VIDTTRDGELDLYTYVEDFLRNSFSTDNPLITEAVKRMLAAGGKRLRPRITLLAAAACGGNPREHLHLAAYMELIHVATLIHDDVVDNAQTRRGVNATAVDYGNRVSVLAGDYLFAWIFKRVTADYPQPVPNILSSTLADICDGEVLQLRALGDLRVPVETYVETVRKKTASLFAASAECGAIMGGGSGVEIDALRRFGELYGVAFQMTDDLLDMTADESSLGKPVGNDLRERKMTIPLILALQSGNPEFYDTVQRLYTGSDSIKLASVVAAIARERGLDATRTYIADFAKQAKNALRPLPASAAREELARLADGLVA